MSQIPVAKPSLIPRVWRFPRRGLLIALLLVAAAALGGVALASTWPAATTVVSAGSVSDLKVDSPVHNGHGFYVVKLKDGEVIALIDQDPHGYPWPGVNDCIIDWRTNLEGYDHRGVFRDTCTGSTFAVNGFHMSGPSPRAMDRYLANVRDGQILVDTIHILTCYPQGDYPGLDCQ